MPKFNFSLQKLLDIKGYEEDQKAIDLGVVQRKLNAEIEKLAQLNTKKDIALQLQTSNLAMRITNNNYIQQLGNAIELQKKNILMAEKEVEGRRQLLLEANRDKQSVEILKEKKKVDHKKSENRLAVINENEVALRINQNKM